MCIAENAFAWVHAPAMVLVEDGSQKSLIEGTGVDLGVELVGGTTAAIEIEHDEDIGGELRGSM